MSHGQRGQQHKGDRALIQTRVPVALLQAVDDEVRRLRSEQGLRPTDANRSTVLQHIVAEHYGHPEWSPLNELESSDRQEEFLKAG